MSAHITASRFFGLAVLVVSFATRAAVPLPDHLVYGTIAIDGKPVTRANPEVTIEARRSSTGPLIASYHMGDMTRLGDFYYALRLPVAAAADATELQAVLGESIVVTVRSGGGIAHQVVHQVTEPGVALRLDFGASVDADGNGAPDGWELATLGMSGSDLDRDSDGDGASDRGEYAAGTQPTDAKDSFRLAVQNDGAILRVSFRALRAAGTGYEGRTRYYSLESSSDPAGGHWQAIENLSRIAGSDQLVIHAQSAETGPAFFRARVWLE